MKNFLAELKRRNVSKVGAAYAAVGSPRKFMAIGYRMRQCRVRVPSYCTIPNLLFWPVILIK